MGRGEIGGRAASARKLLYGPRKKGSGPSIVTTGFFSYERLVESLFDKKIPSALTKALPSLGFSGDPYSLHPDELPAGKLATVVYLNGLANQSMGVTFVEEGGRKTISLDYSAHDGEAPRPGSFTEQAFLAFLADQFQEEDVYVELNLYQRQDIELILDAYGSDFRFAPEVYGSDAGEKEILASLAQDNINPSYYDARELTSFQGFSHMCSSERGLEALNELMRYNDIYLRRPLAEFKNEA